MPRQRWSAEDDRTLIEGAGAFALKWFYNRLKREGKLARTRLALYHRAAKLWTGGLRRGVYSFRQLQLETGYHPDQIRRAQDALNQRFKRLSPRGPYLVSYQQRQDLLAWLANDYWSRPLRLYNCVWCYKRDKPHKGCGMCARCYMAHRRFCQREGLPYDLEELQLAIAQSPIRPGLRAMLCERLDRGWALERDILQRLVKDLETR
jgi:hypothetical protein